MPYRHSLANAVLSDGARRSPLPSPAVRALFLSMTMVCAAGCDAAHDDVAHEDAARGAGNVEAAAEITHRASFATLVTGQYLSADGSGGGTVSAGRGAANAWETFALTDVGGGTLESGDEVFLAAASGAYLSATDGGGSTLVASAPWKRAWESFRVVKLAGSGTIASGDRVALETSAGGHYVSAIDGGGGAVRADAPSARAWETFTITLDGAAPPSPLPPPAPQPPPPAASSPRQQVLDLLASFGGTKTLAGQHNKFSRTPSSASDTVRDRTGKQPALWSGDFLFGAENVGARPTMIAEAKKQWRAGAVVNLMYHACSPTRDEMCEWDDVGGAHPAHLSDAEWGELVTGGTALNAAWLRRLDALAVFLEDLKQAGVAPMFRPLHEMNQGAFWWGGRPGANGTRRLFQITHDYLTITKGLDNLIWVWDVQDFDTLGGDVDAYNPGPDYFDVAALDVYGGGYDGAKYDAMVRGARGKPLAIGECNHVPTAALLAQQPRWAFFMLWPDFIDDNAAALPALYAAPNVVTAERMPGWK